jgi:O-antigen/teichoic acid export membrane protein
VSADPNPPSLPPPDRAVEAGRGALFIGFAKVFFMIAGFAQRVFLTRVVGQADYGAFGVVNNAISTVNNTMVQGTIQSVSKFTAEDDSRAGAVQRAGLRLQAIVGTFIALAVFFGAPLVASFVKAPNHVPLFRLVAAIPLCYAFYAVYVGSANGLRKFRLQASFDVGFSAAKTVLLLGGALVGRAFGYGVTGAFLGFIAAALFILIIANRRISLPSQGMVFPPSRLLIFMGGVALYTLLINLALNYDLLLLRRFAGAALPTAEADALAGAYEAVRNLALLPYQVLLVVTFVIFPLVSRSTFENDQEITRIYIRQTLRYALLIGAALGVVLAARPTTLFGILYPASYMIGASILPILAVGIVTLGLLSVAGSIVTATGRPQISIVLVTITLLSGSILAFALVPQATPGAPMLLASATATSIGMGLGLFAALLYLWRRFSAFPPLLSIIRVVIAATASTLIGRLVPGAGTVMGLFAIGIAGITYALTLFILREFGPTDREKFARILKLRRNV